MQGVLENQTRILQNLASLKQDHAQIHTRMEELNRLVEQTAEMLHRVHTCNFSNMPDNSHVALSCDLVYDRNNTLIGTLAASPQHMLQQDPDLGSTEHSA